MTQLIKFFKYEHLKHEEMRLISEQIANLAKFLEEKLPESAEKTAGMRKLLESKDCFVRAVLETIE